MTKYLLDENVLREVGRRGHANVVAWHDRIEQTKLHISVMTLFEKRRGWERKRRDDARLAETRLAELDALALAYGPRLIPIEARVAAEWARLLGVKDKDRLDRALVATARVHDLVLVTRNVADMRGCDVCVLDPFKKKPTVEIV